MSSLGRARKRNASRSTAIFAASPLDREAREFTFVSVSRKNVASVAMAFSPFLLSLKLFLGVNDFHRSQLRATRRRVHPGFLLAGRERLFRKNKSLPCPLQLPETFFHLAVFERHEGDDDDPATRPHHSRRGFEQRVQFLLLPIDHHSQCHESASRGMQRSRPRCGPFH